MPGAGSTLRARGVWRGATGHTPPAPHARSRLHRAGDGRETFPAWRGSSCSLPAGNSFLVFLLVV